MYNGLKVGDRVQAPFVNDFASIPPVTPGSRGTVVNLVEHHPNVISVFWNDLFKAVCYADEVVLLSPLDLIVEALDEV